MGSAKTGRHVQTNASKSSDAKSVVAAFAASALSVGLVTGIVLRLVDAVEHDHVVADQTYQGVAALVPPPESDDLVPPGVYAGIPSDAGALAAEQPLPNIDLELPVLPAPVLPDPPLAVVPTDPVAQILPDALVVPEQPAAVAMPQQLAPQQQAISYIPQPVTGFEYIGAAEQAVAFGQLFGINVIMAQPPAECGPYAGGCAYEDGTVYISPNSWDESLWMHGSGDFLTRHEFSHIAIFRICGTMDPPIAGDRTEPITDAFAMLFMNPYNPEAHVENVQEIDLEAARQIHAGNCGF